MTPARTLPPGLEAYRRTPEFSETSVPPGLLRAHSTKSGTWGVIRVTEGRLIYRVLDERRFPAELLLTPGALPGIVEPEIVHEVAPDGPVRFHVEFFRQAAAAGAQLSGARGVGGTEVSSQP